MSGLSRRQFLGSSLAAAGGLALSRVPVYGKPLGANDRIRIGVAGIHSRGVEHIQSWLKTKGVEIAYLIDPDTRLFDSRQKSIEAKTKKRPKVVQDVRKALEDKNLDAISVATPNHWHSLITIWACQAGKDVYVEKPLSHNVREGWVAVQAARKYDRIVQHGTQKRSDPKHAAAVAAVRSGKLGKLLLAYGQCYKVRKSIGFKEPIAPPPELDFDLWLGPAPKQAYHENLVHYNWHWFWDTGNGDIGNQGVHEVDVARWGVGGKLPRSVVSLGGRFGYKDQGQTANSQIALYDFDGVPFIFEVRGLVEKNEIGNTFYLEAGKVVDGQFFPKDSDQPAPLPEVEVKLGPGEGNFANFAAAVRSRKRSDQNADVLEGAYSATLCHLANVSYRLGEKAAFGKSDKPFGMKDADETFAKMEEHLREKGVQLEGLDYIMGRKLALKGGDDKTAPQTTDPAANELFNGKGQYRDAFVVPEKA